MGKGFRFVTFGPDLGAFVAVDDGGTGILAGGEFAVGGDDGIFEKGAGHKFIVFAGVGVAKYGGDLLHMGRAEKEGGVVEGFIGEAFEGFRLDDQEVLAVKGFSTDALVGDVAIRGGISGVLNGWGV